MQLDAITRVNQTRESLGRPHVHVTEELTVKAQALADHLASSGQLEHSADLAAGIAKPSRCSARTRGMAAPSSRSIRCSLASPTHFAIMIDPRYTEIGVGITVAADGTVYEVQEYKAP